MRTILVQPLLLAAVCVCSFGISPAHSAQLDIRTFGARVDSKSDDTAAIQKTIDAAEPGDVVLFPGPKLTGISGTGFTLRGKKGIQLRGVNGGGWLILTDATRGMNGFSYVANIMEGCSDCAIEQLVVDGNGRNASPLGLNGNTHCRVTDLVIRNVGRFTGDRNACPSAALPATANHSNRYERIMIDGTAGFPGADGIRGLWIGNGNPAAYEWYPRIVGCRVSRTGYTGIAGHPIAAYVASNEVWEVAGGACIKQVPAPPSVSVEWSLLEQNLCRDSNAQGIQVDWPHHLVLQSNTLERVQYAGIFIAPGQPPEKVNEFQIPNGCADVVIRGNTILDTGPRNQLAGIYVHGATRLEISHNVIRDTRVSGSKTMYSGIAFDASYHDYEDIEIFSNVVEGSLWNGISLWSGAKGYRRVRIHHNLLQGQGMTGLFVDDSQDALAVTLADNTFGPELKSRARGIPHEAPQP